MATASLEIRDVAAAQRRIQPYIRRTPLLLSDELTSHTVHKAVYLKCENFQRTGSFKVRGAMNAVISALEGADSQGRSSKAFVTHSSGNHGAALAYAARRHGAAAHVVVPQTASTAKVNAICSYGAHIHFCRPVLKDRQTTAAAVMSQLQQAGTDAVFVHSYDNMHVVHGQGTLGLEIIEQFSNLSMIKDLEAVVVPVGGGGMLGGIAATVKAMYRSAGGRSTIKVYGAEPAMANDVARSFREHRHITKHLQEPPPTIADGLLTTTSAMTFGLITANVDGIIEVSETEIKRAFRKVLESTKLLIEPSAAVGVAALLQQPEILKQHRGAVCVVVCGGNVEIDKIGELAKL